jgi:hypothetical protein
MQLVGSVAVGLKTLVVLRGGFATVGQKRAQGICPVLELRESQAY